MSFGLTKEEKLGKPQPGVKYPSYWDSTGQVYFTGGQGFAIGPDCQSFILGEESEVLEVLKSEKVPEGASELQAGEYMRIFEIMKGGRLEDGDRRVVQVRSTRGQRVIRSRGIRARPASHAKRKPLDTRRFKTQRVSYRKA